MVARPAKALMSEEALLIWTETAPNREPVDCPKGAKLYHRLWSSDRYATKGSFVPSNFVFVTRVEHAEETSEGRID